MLEASRISQFLPVWLPGAREQKWGPPVGDVTMGHGRHFQFNSGSSSVLFLSTFFFRSHINVCSFIQLTLWAARNLSQKV
jgi:hypothetical protein